jgi:hypothetical protein
MSIPAQTELRSLPTLLFTLMKDGFAIGFLREQNVINDACDLVGSSGYRGGCAQFRSHTTEEITEIAFSATE